MILGKLLLGFLLRIQTLLVFSINLFAQYWTNVIILYYFFTIWCLHSYNHFAMIMPAPTTFHNRLSFYKYFFCQKSITSSIKLTVPIYCKECSYVALLHLPSFCIVFCLFVCLFVCLFICLVLVEYVAVYVCVLWDEEQPLAKSLSLNNRIGNICDWILEKRSKSHIRSFEINGFKELKPA